MIQALSSLKSLFVGVNRLMLMLLRRCAQHEMHHSLTLTSACPLDALDDYDSDGVCSNDDIYLSGYTPELDLGASESTVPCPEAARHRRLALLRWAQ